MRINLRVYTDNNICVHAKPVNHVDNRVAELNDIKFRHKHQPAT